MGERRVHVREVLEAEATGFEVKLTRGVTEKNDVYIFGLTIG